MLKELNILNMNFKVSVDSNTTPDNVELNKIKVMRNNVEFCKSQGPNQAISI